MSLAFPVLIKPFVLAVVLGGVLLSPAPGHAESLWQARRTPFHAYTADTKARTVGDIITIVISESTSVSNNENTELSKSSEASGLFDLETSAEGGFGVQGAAGVFDLKNKSGREFQGGAAYNDSRAFTDRVSVTVIDVLPNGNLVVSGDRLIDLGKDQRRLHVSGIVRSLDISPDNSVNSRLVAEFCAVYVGDGDHRRFSRQGWLGRAVNRIWPF